MCKIKASQLMDNNIIKRLKKKKTMVNIGVSAKSKGSKYL